MAALEFAICAPLLMTFLLGTYDVGRMVHETMRLESAARLGAEYATRAPGDSDGVEQVVLDALPGWDGIEIDPLTISCVCPGAGEMDCSASCPTAPERYVTVAVHRGFDGLLLNGLFNIRGDMTLRFR